MSRTLSHSGSGRLKAPSDGIVAGVRPKGGLSKRWLGLLDDLRATHASQLARGRTLARSGRVRDLWFAPGLASAEVVTTRHAYRVSVRVPLFSEADWRRVVRLLAKDLRHVAALLEGDLPAPFVQALDRAELALFPTLAELSDDCDCDDHHSPCAHAAAVHNVLADALDGDPFLLLTLRGRDREQLLSSLRSEWGDKEPLRVVAHEVVEEPPEADWFSSPAALPAASPAPSRADTPAAALRALGPPPGKVDLVPTLAPLYEAGAEAAWTVATADVGTPEGEGEGDPSAVWEGWHSHAQRARTSRSPSRTGQGPARPAAGPVRNEIATPSGDAFTESLVDLLAEVECGRSTDLAERLGVDVLVVRQELLELEKLGIVYRTGQTRGTRWWLG